MKKKRVTKEPDERRRELIQAAAELFVRQGYEQTSIGDIVAKVGVAQGTFYWYFASKQEALTAIVREMREHIMAVMRNIAEREDMTAIQKLRQMEAEIIELILSQPNLIQAFWLKANVSIQNQLVEKSDEQSVSILISIIRQGMAEGTFRVSNPETSAVFVLALINKFFDLMICSLGIESCQSIKPNPLNDKFDLVPATNPMYDFRKALWEILLRGLGIAEALPYSKCPPW